LGWCSQPIRAHACPFRGLQGSSQAGFWPRRPGFCLGHGRRRGWLVTGREWPAWGPVLLRAARGRWLFLRTVGRNQSVDKSAAPGHSFGLPGGVSALRRLGPGSPAETFEKLHKHRPFLLEMDTDLLRKNCARLGLTQNVVSKVMILWRSGRMSGASGLILRQIVGSIPAPWQRSHTFIMSGNFIRRSSGGLISPVPPHFLHGSRGGSGGPCGGRPVDICAQAHAYPRAVFRQTLLVDGAFGYLEKRPRPKKPRTTNTRMTMTTIQRIDTLILSLGACRLDSPPASSLLHPFTRSVASPGARGATLVGRPR